MYALLSAPAGVGQVLDNGFKLYYASFKHVVGLALLLIVIRFIPGFWFYMSLGDDSISYERFVHLHGANIAVVYFLVLVLSLWIYGVLILRIGAFARGDRPLSKRAFIRGLRCTPALLLGTILYGIVFVLGTLLLIVPGIIVGVSTVFFMFAIVLDGRGPVSGLNYSHQLVWGDWWRTCLMLTVVLLIVLAFYLGFGLVLGGALLASGSAINSPTGLLLQLILEMIVGGLIYPLLYTLLFVHYHDLKLRKEGKDLTDRIDAIGASNAF